MPMQPHNPTSPPRIAIIGSGIAGSAAAYFVREAIPQAEILVFEQASQVGGRIHTMEMAGLLLDTGATLIHSSNQHVVNFLNVLGLERALPHHRQPSDPPSTVGVWNGSSFDLLTSRSAWRTQLRMLLRYRLAPLRLQRLVQEVIGQWTQIYDLQAQQQGFETPEALFRALDVYDLTQESSESYFLRQGIAKRLVEEFVTGISRVNYGQDASINAFVNMVSLAGAGLAGGSLFSVRGGNVQLCQRLLTQANAELYTNNAIHAITGDPETKAPSYFLTTAQGKQEHVNAVIIAAPLEFATLEFHDIELPTTTHQRRAYQTTHATFVLGEPNPSYFGKQQPEELPNLIMTPEDANIPFSSLGIAGYSPHRSAAIYKIFSREPISDELLAKLFTTCQEVKRVAWQAYPVLHPMASAPPFKLAKGLYYVNAMESVVSTMETEAVASQNVVNLLVKDV